MSGKGVREDHINCSAAGLMWVVKHRFGKMVVDKIGVHWVRWVDEDHRFATIQLLPDGTEVFMAEVVIVVTITCEENNAVSF